MSQPEWVIDVDAHVSEPWDVWSARLPAKYKDQGPRLVRDAEGNDIWHVGDYQWAAMGMNASAGWPEPFPSHPKNMDDAPAAAYDAKARLEYMDSIGVWSQVLYPNVAGFGSQVFLNLGDPELMLDCVRVYNDFLVEWCSEDPRRLLPVMATPFWDVQASVAEIERCVAMGHRAMLFTGVPQQFDLPYLGDPHWDPIWSTAQDAGISVSFHVGSGDFSKGFTQGRIDAHGLGAVRVALTVELFLGNAAQVVDLLVSGVLAKFPKLQFVSVESGVGFLPFVLDAADYTWLDGQMWRERPYFDMKPSEYFARQVYGCWFFEDRTLPTTIEAIGPDRLLFETDYPHPVCLYGNVREQIDAALAGQPAAVRQQMLWDNAAKLYKVAEPDRELVLPTLASA
jgi:predicted TIM-barrel fold metal-dependent hydrolase